MVRPDEKGTAGGPLAAHTPLVTLGLPELGMILDEAFGMVPRELFPEAPRPETIGELATLTGKSIAETIRKLQELQGLTTDLLMAAGDLSALMAAATPPIVLDVREPQPGDAALVPGAIRLADTSFADLLPRLAVAPLVITVATDRRRAVSAALYLRHRGLQAKALEPS